MALDSGPGSMAVCRIDPSVALTERGVIRTSIVLFNATNVCFGSRSSLGDCPSPMAGATQDDADKLDLGNH